MWVCRVNRRVAVRRIGIEARSLVAAVELVEPQALEQLVLDRGLCGGLVEAAEEAVAAPNGEAAPEPEKAPAAKKVRVLLLMYAFVRTSFGSPIAQTRLQSYQASL